MTWPFTAPPPGFSATRSWGALTMRALLLVGVIAALAAAAFFFVASRVDDEIRSYMEGLLNDHYGEEGLVVQIDGARLVEGRGVEVRGLKVLEQTSRKKLVEVEEVFIANGATLQDLFGETPQAKYVLMRRVRMYAARDSRGSWNVEQLFPPPKLSDRPPPVKIENSQVEILARGDDSSQKLVLRDINLEVRVQPVGQSSGKVTAQVTRQPHQNSPPSERLQFRLQGEFNGDYVRKISVDALIDAQTGDWSLQGTALDFHFSPSLVALLPPDVGQTFSEVAGLQAEAQFQYRIVYDRRRRDPVQFLVQGKVADGRWENPRLPRPLTNIQSQVLLDNTGFTLNGFSAQAGPTKVHLNARRHGWRPQSALVMEGTVEHLVFDEGLYRALPPNLQQSWIKFSPAGVADLEFRLEWDGHAWRPNTVLTCRNISFAYERFPYRLTEGAGVVSLQNGRLTAKIQAQIEGQTVHIDSELQNPGRRYTGWIEVVSEHRLPISEQIVAAMPEKTRRVLTALKARGDFTFWSRFERRDPTAPKLNYQIKIGALDCTIEYEKFAYQIDRVRGVLEGRDGVWTARRFSGYNGSAFITCNGGWNTGPDGSLSLDFSANDVPLEEELRRALSPGAQRLWMNLRPQGALDELQVAIRYAFAPRNRTGRLSLEIHASKRPSEQNIEGRSISIEPVWLPYRWDNVTGGIHYRDGDIQLKRLRAWHGKTRLTTGGVCRIDPHGGWKVDFQGLTVDRLYADHELTSALPGKLGRAVANLHVIGPVRLYGDLSLAKGPSAPDDGRASNLAAREVLGPTVVSDWDLTVQLVGGSVNCGLKLEHLFGSVKLIGRHDQQGFRTRGELAVDSVIFKDIQFTRISGPMWMDETRVLFGARAPQAAARDRRRSLAAEMFGGKLIADAQVALYGDREFELRASYYEGDLLHFARHFAPRQRNISGKAYGSLVLRGSQLGSHTWQGGGGIRLRQARLYELPVMVSLLKLLSIREPDPTAFTTSDMDFRVFGEVAYFDRIDFKGDAISLKGTGDLQLDGKINFSFYTLVGRTEYLVPGLSRILGEASQRFFLIQVGGNARDPKMTKKVLPGVDELLQKIFPEAIRK